MYLVVQVRVSYCIVPSKLSSWERPIRALRSVGIGRTTVVTDPLGSRGRDWCVPTPAVSRNQHECQQESYQENYHPGNSQSKPEKQSELERMLGIHIHVFRQVLPYRLCHQAAFFAVAILAG